MFLNRKRAQSTVEYITLLLIVVGLFAAFLNSVKNSFQTYHQKVVDKAATG